MLISHDYTTPKFVEAASLPSLENKMRDMIIGSGKKYDFYNFFTYIKRNKIVFVAAYREEIILNLIKKEVSNEN